MSLRFKILLVLVSSTLLSIGAMSLVAIPAAAESVRLEIENALNALADYKVEEIYRRLDEKERAVGTLSRLPAIRDGTRGLMDACDDDPRAPNCKSARQRLEATLTEVKQSLDAYDLFVISPDGTVLLSVLRETDFLTNLSTGPYRDTPLAWAYRRSASRLESALSTYEPYAPSRQDMARKESPRHAGAERHSAFIAAPIVDRARLLGVVALQLREDDHFAVSTDYKGLQTTGETVITKRERHHALVIAPLRNAADAVFRLQTPLDSDSDAPLLRSLREARGSGIGNDYRGREVLAAWRYIPEIEWGVAVKIDSDEVFAPAAMLRQRIFWVAAFITLLVVLFAGYLARKIISPLIALTQSSRTFAGGRFSHRLAVSSADEIGQLSSAFNDMAGRVENLMDSLVEARNTAESANLAKSRFLAKMSHELRTPMHAITSFTELALRRAESGKQARFLNNIKSSASRLTDLLNDLLDLAKLEAGKMRVNYVTRDVAELIREVIADFEGLLLEKRIRVIFEPAGRVSCELDDKLFGQLLANLLSNAIKFSPPDGRIEVTLEQSGETTGSPRGSAIRVSVIDEGPGIASDELETVFESFTQSDTLAPAAKGTGLGLAIVKEILELHGGGIRAVSPPQGRSTGCAFVFWLPARRADDAHGGGGEPDGRA